MSGGSGAVNLNQCASVPNLLFEWHMEDLTVGSGVPYGCSDGDITATLVSSASLTTTQSQDGDYSLYAPTSGDHAAFTISGEDLIKHSSGTIDVWVRPVTSNNYTSIVHAYYDPTNHVIMDIDESSLFRMKVVSDVLSQVTSTQTITPDTWYHVIAKWDAVAHGGYYIEICADTTNGTTNCASSGTAFGAWAGTLTTLRIGEAAGVSSELYVDNLKIYGTWQ